MFDERYIDWNHKKIKTIIDHYGHKFFYKKTILDLGCGQGEIASAFSRLGADVTCVDARQENLDALKKKFPHLKTICCDLEKGWPSNENYDIIFSIGVLCHIKNYERHLENICIYGEHIVLETEVLDSKDPDAIAFAFEEKSINDLSFGGEGSLLSSHNIQNRLSKLGATFKRIDEDKLNSNIYKYNWVETDSGKRNSCNRRIWFIKRDKFLAQQFANNRSIKYAEEEARRQSHEAVQNRTQPQQQQVTKHRNAPPYATMPRALSSTPPITTIPQTAPPPGPDAPKIRLFFNYYEDPNPVRRREIDACLQNNINNQLLEIVILDSQDRPTYDFFFEKINKLATEDDISIICNSDIFFDGSIAFAAKIQHKQLYALSRWDWHSPQSAVLFNHSNSQDAWIVRGKIDNVYGDFQLGRPGCDNRIAYEFQKAGYAVLNPSKTIKAYHMHDSKIRTYNERDRILEPYLFIEPTLL